jgi:hypothetical protein
MFRIAIISNINKQLSCSRKSLTLEDRTAGIDDKMPKSNDFYL